VLRFSSLRRPPRAALGAWKRIQTRNIVDNAPTMDETRVNELLEGYMLTADAEEVAEVFSGLLRRDRLLHGAESLPLTVFLAEAASRMPLAQTNRLFDTLSRESACCGRGAGDFVARAGLLARFATEQRTSGSADRDDHRGEPPAKLVSSQSVEEEVDPVVAWFRSTSHLRVHEYPIPALDAKCDWQTRNTPLDAFLFVQSTRLYMERSVKDGLLADALASQVFDSSVSNTLIDALWASFFASGSSAPVSRVLQVASLWMPYAVEFGLRDRDKVPAHLEDVALGRPAYLLSRGAMFSVVSLASRHVVLPQLLRVIADEGPAAHGADSGAGAATTFDTRASAPEGRPSSWRGSVEMGLAETEADERDAAAFALWAADRGLHDGCPPYRVFSGTDPLFQ